MERLCSPLTCEHLLLADAERYTNQNQLFDFFFVCFLSSTISLLFYFSVCYYQYLHTRIV